MAELSRRGFFKGLFGLALVAAVGKPEVATATVPPELPVRSGLVIQNRALEESYRDLIAHGTGKISYSLTPAHINRFKGEILKHTVPREVLTLEKLREINRKLMINAVPLNGTYVARRYLPYGK